VFFSVTRRTQFLANRNEDPMNSDTDMPGHATDEELMAYWRTKSVRSARERARRLGIRRVGKGWPAGEYSFPVVPGPLSFSASGRQNRPIFPLNGQKKEMKPMTNFRTEY
jgi:hypothetical protein